MGDGHIASALLTLVNITEIGDMLTDGFHPRFQYLKRPGPFLPLVRYIFAMLLMSLAFMITSAKRFRVLKLLVLSVTSRPAIRLNCSVLGIEASS
jgi:hypothetical protein